MNTTRYARHAHHLDRSARALAACAVSLWLGSCQAPGGAGHPGARDARELAIEGPMDGSPAVTFVVPVFFEPVVTVAEDSTQEQEAEPFAPDRGRVKHVRKGPNRFELTLDGVESVRAEQQQDQWCWAACAQMVNAYRGKPLTVPATGKPATQAELAKYYRGDAADQTANLALVIRSLAPEMEPELRAQRVTLGGSLETMSTDGLVEDLSRGELAVLGLREEGGGGHACVVIGLQYGWLPGGATLREARELWEASEGQLEDLPEWADEVVGAADGWVNALAVHEVTVFDPWDGGSVRTIAGHELGERCAFLMTPSLARKILETPRQTSLADGLEKGLKSSFERLWK